MRVARRHDDRRVDLGAVDERRRPRTRSPSQRIESTTLFVRTSPPAASNAAAQGARALHRCRRSVARPWPTWRIPHAERAEPGAGRLRRDAPHHRARHRRGTGAWRRASKYDRSTSAGRPPCTTATASGPRRDGGGAASARQPAHRRRLGGGLEDHAGSPASPHGRTAGSRRPRPGSTAAIDVDGRVEVVVVRPGDAVGGVDQAMLCWAGSMSR